MPQSASTGSSDLATWTAEPGHCDLAVCSYPSPVLVSMQWSVRGRPTRSLQLTAALPRCVRAGACSWMPVVGRPHRCDTERIFFSWAVGRYLNSSTSWSFRCASPLVSMVTSLSAVARGSSQTLTACAPMTAWRMPALASVCPTSAGGLDNLLADRTARARVEDARIIVATVAVRASREIPTETQAPCEPLVHREGEVLRSRLGVRLALACADALEVGGELEALRAS